MLPNFLLVGAEKAGTTSLASMLAEHPEIFMCEPKEPRYFTQNWRRGIHWYESLFDGAVSEKAIGEASPAYTWAPESAGTPFRIYKTLGDIKYLYLVRHPLHRMISHYRHALIYHWIPQGTSFEAALELIPCLKNCSRYHYQVEQYLEVTSPEQWHVLALEDLTKDPQEIQEGLFRFLEVDWTFRATLRSEHSSDSLKRPPVSFDRLRAVSGFAPNRLTRLGKRLIMKSLGVRIPKPNLSQETVARLSSELHQDVCRLSEFCSRDFAALWGLAETS